MRRRLPSGIELDDDPDRVDVDAVHAYLANESYWAEGRPREIVELSLRTAARVVALYDGTRQIGFCRVVSDGFRVAYLADVYVLPGYRGRGLGTELIREAVENGPHANCVWLLHTRDAHDLYERFGFARGSHRLMERPRRP
jgi:GNAT superfamily N-acetyltransferase